MTSSTFANNQVFAQDADSKPISRVYTALIVVMFAILATHAAPSLLATGPLAVFSLAVARQVPAIILWVIGFVVMAKGARRWTRTLPAHKLVWALPTVALLSTIWSVQPRSTVITAIYLGLTTLFAVFFTEYYSPLQQMRLTIAAGLVIALSSILLYVALPAVGVTQEGNFQGIYLGKNVCALLTMFFLMPALFYPARNLKTRVFCWLYIAGNLGIIVLTHSRTTLAIAIAIIAISIGLNALERLRRPDVLLPFAIAFLATAGTVLFLFFNASQVLARLGGDTGLHGRAPIWDILTIIIARRPLLGYGYSAFWLHPALPTEVSNYTGWNPGYAHNGILDVLLSVGFLGLFTIFLLVLRAAKDTSIVFYSRRGKLSNWYISIFLLTVMYNLDEGFLGAPNSMAWFLFLVACLMLGKAIKETPRTKLT